MISRRIAKKHLPPIIGLLLVAVTLWLQFTSVTTIQQAMQRLDLMVYDLRLRTMLPRQVLDPRIVIVDIDEKSLHAEGHWPWPRDRVAQLVDQLSAEGAAVVGFDIVFAEAERNSGEMVLRRLQAEGRSNDVLRSQLTDALPLFDNNRVLAESLSNHETVLGYIFGEEGGEHFNVLPRPLSLGEANDIAHLALPQATGYIGNVAILQKTAASGGFFNVEPDADGIIRRAPIVERYGNSLYASLGLEVARLYLSRPEVTIQTGQVGDERLLEAVELGQSYIPTDSDGQVVIRYHGRRGSYPYVSATDVLHNQIPRQQLDGRIVLVGTTAQGLFDLRATPIQAVFPGVEVHANIVSSILDNDFPVAPDWSAGANFLLTLLLGVVLALLLPRLAPLLLLAVSISVLAAIVTLNFWLWSEQGLILQLAPLLLLVLLLAGFNMAYGFLSAFHDKRQLQGMFGQYVPPELVKEMSENPERYGFEGESREMSVLFADIRSFTTISESLTANKLKEMLNHFFTPMTRVIFENRGTIDKYVGDMVMAFWGAPVEDPKNAAHAIDAALGMLREVEHLKGVFATQGYPPIQIGIGVNSGVMNVGDMGSEYRRAYTVLGDTVNLASRLEGTTKYYRVGLVIGERTRELAGDDFVYRELDLICVKGKAHAVHIYQPLCRRHEAEEQLLDELRTHDEALQRYRGREWARAAALFAELHTAHPDVWLYELYLQRLDVLQKVPPAGEWDGIYEMTEK